ncbi:MAG: hypothetical protein ACYTG7_26505, partial [Planctomycetota bacterium]
MKWLVIPQGLNLDANSSINQFQNVDSPLSGYDEFILKITVNIRGLETTAVIRKSFAQHWNIIIDAIEFIHMESVHVFLWEIT